MIRPHANVNIYVMDLSEYKLWRRKFKCLLRMSLPSYNLNAKIYIFFLVILLRLLKVIKAMNKRACRPLVRIL